MILPVGRDGDGSALVVFLASIRCSVWGHSDPHAGRIDVHIAPDVGATSFGSPPVANRAHRRTISAAPQEVAVAAQLQGWMLAWGISGACQITSEHFWIDGGDCGEGRAAARLSGASAEAVPFPGIAGRSTSLLRFLRRKESNEIGYE
jgi:hypothetical protein